MTATYNIRYSSRSIETSVFYPRSGVLSDGRRKDANGPPGTRRNGPHFFHRAYARVYETAPIVYAETPCRVYRKAMLYNLSKDGAYFETSRAIQPGTALRLKIRNPDEALSSGLAERVINATVIWCKTFQQGTTELYGVRVKFEE